MTKRKKISYWVATVWLALGMLSTGIVQIIKNEEEVKNIEHLGFPVYVLTLIGIWKILGVIAILIPKYPLLKEWTYAGLFFNLTGAIFSHISVGNSFDKVFPSLLLLTLCLVSYFLRPADRKI